MLQCQCSEVIYIYESDLSDRRFLFRSHQARIADSRSSFGCALPSRNKRHVTACGAERFTNAVITIRFDCNMNIPRPSEIQLLLLLLLLFLLPSVVKIQRVKNKS